MLVMETTNTVGVIEASMPLGGLCFGTDRLADAGSGVLRYGFTHHSDRHESGFDAAWWILLKRYDSQ